MQLPEHANDIQPIEEMPVSGVASEMPGASDAPRPSPIRRVHVAIAGGVVGAAIIVGVGLGFVLGNQAGASLGAAASYVPADAVMYMEARLDLPGDQRANLRAILDRFPSADADAVLTDELAASLDNALSMGQAPFDYSHDVASWFTGRVSLALFDYPISMDPTQMELPSALLVLGSRDADLASSLADDLRASPQAQGASFTSHEVGGVTVWALDIDANMPGAGMMPAGAGFAYAVTDDAVLLGNGADIVDRALGVHGGSEANLTTLGGLAGLTTRLPDDAAGFAVLNSRRMMAEMRDAVAEQAPSMADAMDAYLHGMPPVSVSSLRFAADGVELMAVSDAPTADGAPSNETRSLADHVPGDAIFFADASGAGSFLSNMVLSLKSTYAAMPGVGAAGMPDVAQIEDALGASMEDFVSWVDDAAVVAGWDGTSVYGGAIFSTDDPDTARRRLDQLRALARMASSSGGADLQVSTAQVDGVEVTTFSSGPAVVAQYAVDGDIAILGGGDGFVGRVLATDASASLGASDRLRSAAGKAGGLENTSTFFLDLVRMRAAIEEAASTTGADLTFYRDQLEANLEPLDYLVGVTRLDGDHAVTQVTLQLR